MAHCKLSRRSVDSDRASFLQSSLKLTPLEAQLLASRGVAPDAPTSLTQLLDTPLADLTRGAARVVEAIQRKEHIVVVADYDCDGATSCAVTVAGLRALGASIDYVVPDRMIHGYGISPSVVELVRERYPRARLILTVDNGILGHAGIAHAVHLGMEVVVTDHHLQGETLPPDAVAVINPARRDCPSGLSRLAGVGVALWLVYRVKGLLTAQGINTPSLGFLLPYLAIGTVADMVQLDAANRLLVSHGLQKIRAAGEGVPVGIQALIVEAGLAPHRVTSMDIGFALAPRINAAGRLETMDAGINLLLATDPKEAKRLARMLTETNLQRKALQKEATKEATANVDVSFEDASRALVYASTEWHPGIVGLVASRIKDTYHRPTFIFSLVDGVAKGSGRSIPGLHLKDALEEVARRDPEVLAKFGGHAMAAGATLTGPGAVDRFRELFTQVCAERVTDEMLQQVILTDGPMPDMSLELAARVMRHPWGQGFEAPSFDDEVRIVGLSPLGQAGIHWRLSAAVGGRDHTTPIVMFNTESPPTVGETVHLHLQPGLNTWNNNTTLQWIGKAL